ncbi:MAG: tandem-95 repeat protein [Arcobacteraceae bacterium]|nr:tandem-95 repeat protein [Arcobacteraceae bacterium]
MSQFTNFIIVFVVTLFLTACGGGGGTTTSSASIDLNGIAVDNYISGATVCIDTNKNNTCDNGERNTTTNNLGEFTFTDVLPTDDMVIIAYGGRDADTNVTFPYIIKNIATNTDSNSKVVLSSLNSLVTDYKFSANTTLLDAKNKILNFVDLNSTALLIADLVANKNSYPEVFAKSLQIFQMIEKINTTANLTNNYTNSAKGFNALAVAIKNSTTPIKYNDANINVTINSTTINAAVTNMKPVFISSPTVWVNENQTNAITLVAHDDNSSLTYSVSDTTNFNIDSASGVVTFKNTPDFESATTTYSFIASVSDGSSTVTQDITINLLNVNEAPTTTFSSFSTNEDTIYNGTLTGTDVEGSNLTYSIESNTTNGVLSLNSNGTFTYTPTANFSGTDSFTYKVNDGLLNSAIQTVTISVTGINDSPIATYSSFTIDEDSVKSGQLTGTDLEGSSLIYSKVSDPSHGSVTINANGTFTYTPTANFNGTDSFTYKVNDGSLDSTMKTVSVTVSSVNDAPIFTNGTNPLNIEVFENQTAAVTVNATDADNDTLTYALSGTDGNSFTIDNQGVVTFISAPDYESVKKTYNLIVTVSDSNGASTTKTILITIKNQNDNSPIFNSTIQATVNENQKSVMTLYSTDADNDTLSYSISGDDVNYFDVNTSTGVVTFKNNADYEIKTSYTFTATASDNVHTDSKVVTILLNNLNDNVPIFTNGSSVSKAVDSNETLAIRLQAADIDGLSALSYSISGTDAGYFNIDNTTGVVSFINRPDTNLSKTSYQFVATVSDGDISHDQNQTVTIYINSLVVGTPVFTSANYDLVVNENFTGTLIDLNATDPNSDPISYGIVVVGDGDLFNINSTTGFVTFKNAPDFESGKTSYSFTVTASDGTNTVNKDITVTILNLNDNVPVFTSNATVTANENQTSAITLSATDADNNTLAYSISGTDASYFTNTSGVITFNNAPDYESGKITYTFVATVSDGESAHDQNQTITINIGNLADNPPIFTSGATATKSVNENQTSAISLAVTGGNSALSYSISGTDAGYFNIVPTTGVVTFKTAPNFESGKTTYTFTATVTDGTSTPSQIVTITILDANDVATFITSQANTTIYQGEYFEYTAKAKDVDAGQTLTYQTHVSVSGFSIATLPNTDNTNQVEIFVNGTPSDISVGIAIFKLKVKENATGNYITQDFNVTVLDINDAPKFTTTPSDVNISFGATLDLANFTIEDGDSKVTQLLDINATSSNTNVVSINSIVNNSGIVTLKLNGLEVGESNITINLHDNGGIAHGGHDTTSFTFKATVRANGWKIYENQKASNYTNNSINFDGITYVWDSTNRWYSTVDANVSLEKILMPVGLLTSYNTAENMTKVGDGHFYVLKNNYINNAKKGEGISNTTSTTYDVVSGSPMVLKSTKMQHDPLHHLFVSKVVLKSDYTEDGKTYYSIFGTPTFVNSPESNTTYGTDVNVSIAYANKNVYIDNKNNGTNYCKTIFGAGWRIPTSYEAGINILSGNSYKGFVPAYLDESTTPLMTSTKYNSNTSIWELKNTGYSRDATTSTTLKIRCVYGLF